MCRLLSAGLILSLSLGAVSRAEDLAPLLEKIRAVGPQAQGHAQAIDAWKELAKADAAQLPDILAGMNGAGELATNWLRSAAETIADRQTADGGKLPVKEIEAFVADTDNAPRARRLAYELIRQVDPGVEQRVIPGMLNDASLELRRDAVAMALDRAAALADSDKDKAAEAYREALSSARDIDQVKDATKSLRDLGQEVNLPEHFGFIMSWRLIGPFDNTDKKGFDVSYPPEEQLNAQAELKGKEGPVKWSRHSTTDEYGLLDLNKAIGKHMGATAYAWHEFESDSARDVEIRYGTKNGNKLWLNGKLLHSRHDYHSNMQIDQYVGNGRLKKGKNTILVKICQNEQTEDWAQDWNLQLRVCDQYGTAVLSANRASDSGTDALDR